MTQSHRNVVSSKTGERHETSVLFDLKKLGEIETAPSASEVHTSARSTSKSGSQEQVIDQLMHLGVAAPTPIALSNTPVVTEKKAPVRVVEPLLRAVAALGFVAVVTALIMIPKIDGVPGPVPVQVSPVETRTTQPVQTVQPVAVQTPVVTPPVVTSPEVVRPVRNPPRRHTPPVVRHIPVASPTVETPRVPTRSPMEVCRARCAGDAMCLMNCTVQLAH